MESADESSRKLRETESAGEDSVTCLSYLVNKYRLKIYKPLINGSFCGCDSEQT